jgi:cytochrome c biogenesis protein CcmG, thiol:disulfide interchange protein DsbE
MSSRSPASRPSSRTARPPSGGPPSPGGGNRTALIVGIVAALVLVALAVAVLAGGGDDGDDTATGGQDGSGQTAGTGATQEPPGIGTDVTVEGEPLTPHERGSDPAGDPAVGETVPTLTGIDIDGNPITIAPDGRAKMIVVLAHWCPHCQAEVPVIVDWVADGGLPDDVDLVGIATANSPERPNYPARPWLDDEGWDAPTLLDDSQQTAGLTMGTSAYPFMVVTNADGEVVARTSGELTPDQLSDLVAEAEGS